MYYHIFANKKRKLIIWLKSAEIQYLKPADSTLKLYFKITKEDIRLAENTLNEKGIYATYYHGGMDQDERERALIQFRNGSMSYLITTDLAARGLDIPNVSHVINFDRPKAYDDYVHRIGRTGRAGAMGRSSPSH